MRTRDQVLLGVVALTVVVAAVLALILSGSDSDELANVAASTPPISERRETPIESSTTTGGLASASDDASVTTTAATATEAPVTTSSSAPPRALEIERQVLGELPQGGGELVRLVELDDSECSTGALVVEVDGRVSHFYGDSYGYLRLFPGPFGQAAMVEQCEESIGPLLFTDTVLLGPGDAPAWSVVAVPDEVFYLSGLGWFGLTGFFGADAMFYDGQTAWTEAVVFDTFDGSMTPWAEKFGSRDEHPVLGIDFVVPSLWNYAPIDELDSTVSMWDTESSSWVDIEVSQEAVVVPSPWAGEELVATTVHEIDLWTDKGRGRAGRDGNADAVDYRFAGDDGVRTVRVVTLEDRSITVESFLSDWAGQAHGDVSAMAVNAVRIFTAVG